MIWHFTAHTINCVCHSIRWMFRVLGMCNFGLLLRSGAKIFHETINPKSHSKCSTVHTSTLIKIFFIHFSYLCWQVFFLNFCFKRISTKIPIHEGKENRTRSNALAETFHQQLFIDMCLDIKYSNGFCANTLWNFRKQINPWWPQSNK